MSGLYDPYGKKIDEGWKERVARERRPARQVPAGQAGSAEPAGGPKLAEDRPRGKESPGGEFGLFLSSLSMQAMVALGEMPHPVTRDRQVDLDQARYLIDVLGLLQEKTRGNLTPEESELLEGLLYELRMKYVERTQGAAQ